MEADSFIRLDDSLSEAEAAVYGEDLAGDEVGAGGEEEDGLGYIAGGAVALERRAGGEVAGFFRLLLVQIDPARRDAVYADLRRERLGHGLRQRMERGLGGAIVGVGGPGAVSAEGADVDDAAVG